MAEAKKRKRKTSVAKLPGGAEAERLAERELDKPNILQRIAGTFDVPGVLARSGVANELLAKIERAEKRKAGDELGPLAPLDPLVGQFVRTGVSYGAPIAKVLFGEKATEHVLEDIERAGFEMPEKMLDPLAGAAASFKGDVGAGSYGTVLERLRDSSIAPEPVKTALKNPLVMGISTAAADIFGDPFTYATFGQGSAAKGMKAAKLAEIAEGGVTAEKLSEIGLDAAELVAKHVDDADEAARLLDALTTTGAKLDDIPAEMAHDIAKAASAWAGKAVEGAPRKIGIPFLYKTEEGLRPGAWAPYIRKMTEEEAAASAAKGYKTLMERAGLTMDVAATKAVREGAEHAAVTLGKHAADTGGFKIAGQTVFDVQPYIDDIAFTVKRFLHGKLPAGETALSKVASAASEVVGTGVNRVARLFSVHANVDNEANALLSAWARASKGQLDAMDNMAAQAGHEVAMDMAQRMSPQESQMFGRAREEVLTAEEHARLSELVEARKQAAEAASDYIRKHGLTTPEKVEQYAARHTGRLSTAEERLSAIDDEAQRIRDAIEAIRNRLGVTTSYKTSRAAGKAEGKASALSQAAEEARRMSEAAVNEMVRMVRRFDAYDDKAGRLLDEAAETERLLPLAKEAPPATGDELLKRIAGIEDQEKDAADHLIEALRSFYAQGFAWPVKGHPLSEEARRAIDFPGIRYIGDHLNFNRKRKQIETDWLAAYLNDYANPQGILEAYGITPDLSVGELFARIEDILSKRFKAPKADDVLAALDVPETEIAAYVADRAKAALMAGDAERAAAWLAVGDDALGRIGREAGGMFEGARIGKAEADVAERAAELLPELQRKRLEAIRERVTAALAAGKAEAYREVSREAGRLIEGANRIAARGAERTERFAAQASEQAKRLAELKDAAWELKRHELRLETLARKRAALRVHKQYAETAAGNALRIIDGAIQRQAKVAALDDAIRELVSRADYAKSKAWLVAQGVAEERADELVALMRELDEGILKQLLRAKNAAGLVEAEKLPGLGSMGYSPHMMANAPGPVERLGGVLSDELGIEAGDLLKSERTRLRDEYLKRVYGTTSAELQWREPTGLRIRVGGFKPKQPEAAYYKTEAERIAAGSGMETDWRIALGSKVRHDISEVAKAQFEDRLVRDVGHDVSDLVEQLAQQYPDAAERASSLLKRDGYSIISVTRDGTTRHYAIPDFMKDWLDGFKRLSSDDEAANAALRGLDRVTSFLRKQMTVWRLPFHLGNAQSNFVLAAMHDLGDPAAFEDAARALAAVRIGKRGDMLIDVGGGKKMRADELLASVEGYVLRGQTGASDLSASLAERSRLELPRKDVLSELRRTLSPTRLGTEAGSFIEDAGRLGVYLAAKRKGMTEAAARMMPDKVLYNYMPSNFTRFEQGLRNRIIMFYAWMRQNAPEMLRVIAHRPATVTAFMKVRNAGLRAEGIDEKVLPQWMRDMLYVPVPGAAEEGKTLLFSPRMFAFQDVAAIPTDAEGVARELASRINPLFRTLLFELPMGYDLYYKRAIEKHGPPSFAPWYIEKAVKSADAAFGDSEAWKRFRTWLGVYDMEDEDGRPRIGITQQRRKLLRDLLPFFEGVGKLFSGESAEKEQLDRFSYLTGITVRQIDKAVEEERYGDELARLARDILKDLEARGVVPRKRKKR